MATIQGVYVALFGRPADPTGLAYFNSVTSNGANLNAIGNLASTAEYQARFSGLNNVQIINSIYQSLFGRDADLTGLNFFSDALAKGTLNINNIAIAILDGAQGNDKTIVTNKVAAADLYTKALDTGAEVVAYSGLSAAAAGRTFLTGVTTTVPTAAAVDTAVAAMVTTSTGGGTGTAGVTLTLNTVATTPSDFISPDSTNSATKTTAGNDTIRGVGAGDLGSVDSIDGGAGTDTLNAAMVLNSATAVKPVLKSIENVNLTYGTLAAKPTFDAGDSTGIVKLTIADVTTAGGNDTFTIANLDKSATAAFKNLSDAVATTAVVGFTNVAGTSDAATISLEKVGGAAGFTLDVAGIERLTVNSTGAAAADTNTVVIKDAVVQTLTVTGDKNITITNDGGNATLKTVDASALNGTFTYTATNNGETITGSAKADVITLGNGNDTVVFNKAGVSVVGAIDEIKQFNAVAADKIDLKAFALGSDTTIKTITTTPTADVAGVFDGTNRIAFNNTDKLLYVDVNKDGNFNAASDLVIKLTGVAVADLDKTDFLLA